MDLHCFAGVALDILHEAPKHGFMNLRSRDLTITSSLGCSIKVGLSYFLSCIAETITNSSSRHWIRHRKLNVSGGEGTASTFSLRSLESKPFSHGPIHHNYQYHLYNTIHSVNTHHSPPCCYSTAMPIMAFNLSSSRSVPLTVNQNLEQTSFKESEFVLSLTKLKKSLN